MQSRTKRIANEEANDALPLASRGWGDLPDWVVAASGSIMRAVQMKDPDTASHCARVGAAAGKLAQAAGLNEYSQRVCEFAGLFHDIGKVGIPDEILLKPGRLTPEEFEKVKEHAAFSVQMLEPLKADAFVRDLLPGVRYHHERFDGQGYPAGVRGERIPLESRIILVVDTFDAMTADRAYRKGLPAEAAYKELKLFAGRQFDAKLVEIFLKSQPTWKRANAPERGSPQLASALKLAA